MSSGPASLPPFLLECLACPACGAPLLPEGGVALRCQGEHRAAGVYPIRAGIARLLPKDRVASDRGANTPTRQTVRAFERQWRHYSALRRIFGKDARQMADNLVGARLSARIDPRWYVGRTVLDAGCGHGRYLRAFRDLGARVVGLDVGTGPERAGVKQEADGLALVQGDVLSPPFLAGSFDLVFCDGVLHHTQDPMRGYQALARLLKPGGALYVWLYPREGWLREAVFGCARAVTTRLPGAAVRWLSFALAPLTLGVRSYSATRLGRATWGECAQVVHDWLAPPLQSHHTAEEVAGWAREACLIDLEPLPVPVGLTAWRADAP